MKTWIDIPDDILKKLDPIASEKRISRAKLIGSTLCLLTENTSQDVFGIFQKSVDPPEYQRCMRAEW